MSQNKISIPIEVVDRFSDTFNRLKKSIDELTVSQKVIASYLQLENRAKEAAGGIDLISAASKAFKGINVTESLLFTAKNLKDLGVKSNIAAAAGKAMNVVAKATAGIFAGLVVLDLATWFWNIATAAQQAAQKIRDEFNAAIAEIDDNTAATQALITQYITLREKTSLTAAEQSILAELAERLAETFPELGDEVRNLSGDFTGLKDALQNSLQAEVVKQFSSEVVTVMTDIVRVASQGGQQFGEEFRQKLVAATSQGVDEVNALMESLYNEAYRLSQTKEGVKDVLVDDEARKQFEFIKTDVLPYVENLEKAQRLLKEAAGELTISQRAWLDEMVNGKTTIDQFKGSLEGLSIGQLQAKYDALKGTLDSLIQSMQSSMPKGGLFNIDDSSFTNLQSKIDNSSNALKTFKSVLDALGLTIDETGNIVKKVTTKALTPLAQAEENVRASMENMKPALVTAYEELLLIGKQVELDGGKTLPDYADRILELVKLIKELGGEIPESTQAFVEQAAAMNESAKKIKIAEVIEENFAKRREELAKEGADKIKSLNEEMYKNMNEQAQKFAEEQQHIETMTAKWGTGFDKMSAIIKSQFQDDIEWLNSQGPDKLSDQEWVVRMKQIFHQIADQLDPDDPHYQEQLRLLAQQLGLTFTEALGNEGIDWGAIGTAASNSFLQAFSSGLQNLDMSSFSSFFGGIGNAFSSGFGSSVTGGMTKWFGEAFSDKFVSSFAGQMVSSFIPVVGQLASVGLNKLGSLAGDWLSNVFGGGMSEEEFTAKAAPKYLAQWGGEFTAAVEAEMQKVSEKWKAIFGKTWAVAATSDPAVLAQVLNEIEDFTGSVQAKFVEGMRQGINNEIANFGASEFEAFSGMADNIKAAFVKALEGGEISEALQLIGQQAKNLGIDFQDLKPAFEDAFRTLLASGDATAEQFEELVSSAEQLGIDITEALNDALDEGLKTLGESLAEAFSAGDMEALDSWVEEFYKLVPAMEAVGRDVRKTFDEMVDSAVESVKAQIRGLNDEIYGLFINIDDLRRSIADMKTGLAETRASLKEHAIESGLSYRGKEGEDAYDSILGRIKSKQKRKVDGEKSKKGRFAQRITLREEREILKGVKDEQTATLIKQLIAQENALVEAKLRLQVMKDNKKATKEAKRELKQNLPTMKEKMEALYDVYKDFGANGLEDLRIEVAGVRSRLDETLKVETETKASGGPIYSSQVYTVGEAGPEFVMGNSALNRYGLEFMSAVNAGRYRPQQPNVVVSERQPSVINVNIQADNPEGFRAWMRRGGAKEVAEMVERAKAFGGARSVGGM